MTAVDAQLSAVPDAARRMGALAFCPLSKVVIAVEAAHIAGVWDPLSEPGRANSERCIDLAAHFGIEHRHADAVRRRLQLTIHGEPVTFVVGDKVIIEAVTQAALPLPAVVAALAERGVRHVLAWQAGYAFVVDLAQVVRLVFPSAAPGTR